jgi:cyclin B
MKTLANVSSAASITLPSRTHEKSVGTNVSKPKESSVLSGKSKSTRPRDALSNITNVKKSSDVTKKNVSKSSKKVKATKRPSAVLESELKNKGKEQKSKKRKSDPMIIDEEEQNNASSASSLSTTGLIPYEDIDQNDFDDPQAVAEYVNDIYEYLMEKEKDGVDPRYINSQVDVNEKMRAILVDWLVEVHRMFKLLPETLFLSVALIDRYLSLTQISREKLQLVGVTAMLIASKYEEIYAPECNDFVYISDGAYTKQQILKMEQTLLNTLNFNITHPSSLHFLRRYSKAAGSDYTLHTLCKYLIELMLIDVKLLKYPPSVIAAASVYLARAMTQRTPLWTPTLEHYTTYNEQQVRECALEMNELLKKSQKSSLKAIRKKYSLPKFGQVADLPLVEL